jgi:hypothetical protein
MKAFQETTDWAWPNHIYFLNDGRDKMYGYVRDDGRVEVFTKPYRFHVRGRKFREVKNTWNFGVDDTPGPSKGKEYQVAGSKGAVYTVTNDRGSWTCTCPSAKWQKAECKHIVALKAETV